MRDDTEVAEFIRERSTALLRYAVLLTGDRTAAEDLLQDALVRTYESWRRIDNPDAYTRRALYTLAVSRWRRLTRRERVTDAVPEHGSPGPEDWFVEQDALLLALSRLSLRARTAIVLRYYEDRTDLEIAEILDVSPGAVRTMLTRARQQLRAALTPVEAHP